MDELMAPLAQSVVAVAVSGSTKTKNVVNWALEKFVKKGMTHIKLLHVRPVILRIPTPMGNFIPIAQARHDIATAYRMDVERKVSEKLLPYKNMCTKRQVHVEIMQIEWDDVEAAISREIQKHNINRLVIGISSNSIFSRGDSLSSKISQSCPAFCTVYVISKGKVSNMRPSDYETDNSLLEETSSETSDNASSTSSPKTVSKTEQWVDESFSQRRSSSLRQFPTNNQNPHYHKRVSSDGTMLNELQRNRVAEQVKMQQIKFKEKELAKQRYEADLLNQTAEREVAEVMREYQGAQENAFLGYFQQYRRFTLEEIEWATLSFSEDLKIGMGAYGTVYKCSFQLTTAAVRKIYATEASKSKQFQQELEILSQIRHPHLLTLLGACHERACLVYEFIENGSLQDKLFEKNNTHPLLWFERFRIAWEIASALAFLHTLKPKSIIHHDLKPSNIFLGRDYVCKIGGFSLSVVIDENADSTSNKDTSPVGTNCYMDPEYQRTRIVSPESDVYALGMIILQLLTGLPATGLAHVVEVALKNDNFLDILDKRAGEWPDEESWYLADLALRCTELRRIDRPDFHNEVIPAFEKIKLFAEKVRDTTFLNKAPVPNHFICPILKEVMTDPCVAADGYTYDRKGIEPWLCGNDNSPMTKELLPHKLLLSNHTLLYAIMDWKSGKE